MKVIIDRYVITTDSDINGLLTILKKYDVKAYNYKVTYVGGKVHVRVIKGNVIVNVANADLTRLEEILKESEEAYSRYWVEFHNTPSKRQVVERIESLNLPYSEFHVFSDHVKVKTINGHVFEDSLDLEATYYLSFYLDKVRPGNLGRIKKVKDMYILALLKLYGVRNLDVIERIAEIGRVDGEKIVIGDVTIDERGIFKGGKPISKEELYKVIKMT